MQEHWLRHPSIVDAMEQVHLFLKVDESVLTIRDIQKTSLHTLTPEECSNMGIQIEPNFVQCRYKRRKGGVEYKAIPVSAAQVSQLRIRSIAIVVRNPGVVWALDQKRRTWGENANGDTVIGKCFDFLKKDFADRNRPKTGFVAALRVREQFVDHIPIGSFIRIPIEYVCGAECIL